MRTQVSVLVVLDASMAVSYLKWHAKRGPLAVEITLPNLIVLLPFLILMPFAFPDDIFQPWLTSILDKLIRLKLSPALKLTSFRHALTPGRPSFTKNYPRMLTDDFAFIASFTWPKLELLVSFLFWEPASDLVEWLVTLVSQIQMSSLPRLTIGVGTLTWIKANYSTNLSVSVSSGEKARCYCSSSYCKNQTIIK